MKYSVPHGPLATPASKFVQCAAFQPAIKSSNVLPVTPIVLAMLLAVPIGSTAIGMRLSTRRRATPPTVPSPPATAMISQGFWSAFFHFLSFDEKYFVLFAAFRIS